MLTMVYSQRTFEDGAWPEVIGKRNTSFDLQVPLV